MPNFVNNTITINGEGQIAAALAKQQLAITRVQVGSGVANIALPSLTALVAPIMNLTPQPPQVSANNLQTGEVVVMAVLDAANVTTIFPLAELGVFATSAGGPEQLIAYCQCSSPYDTMAPGSGSNRLILNLQVPIVVGVGASVSITVQAGNPVYVPPVVAGPGIVVDAPTDTSGRIIEWIVSTPQITKNTTLYVNNSYTQNIAPYFDSLSNAFNYLDSFTIASGVDVYVNMAPQTFSIKAPIWVSHTNSSQITIQGANNPDVTFKGIGSIQGTVGNWKVQLLNVSSTANIKVGMWLNIYAASFQWWGTILAGMYQVTGVSGSTVTIQSYYWSTYPNVAGGAGTMTPLTTILSYDNPQMQYGLGFLNGIGLLQYVAVVMPGGYANNYPASGLYMGGGSGVFKYVGVWGVRGNTNVAGGIVIANSYGLLQRCCSSFNDDGVVATGAGANATIEGCAVSHNLARGVWGESNSNTLFSSGTGSTNFVGGNRNVGVMIVNGSYCAVMASYINGQVVQVPVLCSYNASYGYQISNQSRTGFNSSSCVFWASNNGQYDVVLTAMSLLPNSSWVQGSRIFNGTPGVLMADGSLFD